MGWGGLGNATYLGTTFSCVPLRISQVQGTDDSLRARAHAWCFSAEFWRQSLRRRRLDPGASFGCPRTWQRRTLMMRTIGNSWIAQIHTKEPNSRWTLSAPSSRAARARPRKFATLRWTPAG